MAFRTEGLAGMDGRGSSESGRFFQKLLVRRQAGKGAAIGFVVLGACKGVWRAPADGLLVKVQRAVADEISQSAPDFQRI